ncbi:MAG: hypothetical protein PHR23_06570 [bacterium]|nr:hypothetical protein [bacterium]
MAQRDLEARWITPDGIPGVLFRFGNSVRVIAGECAGQTGRVVALLSLEPEPLYVIEFMQTGKSVNVIQSALKKAV